MDKIPVNIGALLGVPLSDVTVTETVESNTAFTMKVTVNDKRLFIKSSKPSSSYHEMALREVDFYRYINNSVDVVPHCYDAYKSGSDYRIVLDDISVTHGVVSDFDDENTWLSCAESLAKFHAVSWNHKLESDDDDSGGDNTQQLREFLEYAGDRFTAETIEIYHQVFALTNVFDREVRQRIKSAHNITVTNGDSHIYNFMLPKHDGVPMIIDFQFWGNGTGAGDLAHLTRVAFNNTPLHRRIVETYHAALLANGVTGYSFDECVHDYRMNVAGMVFIPMWQYVAFDLPYESWSGDVHGLIRNFKCVTEDL